MGWGYYRNSCNRGYTYYPQRRFCQIYQTANRTNTNSTTRTQTTQSVSQALSNPSKNTQNSASVQKPITSQSTIKQPAAKDIYKSNNPYATIARCYTGDYNQIYNKCVSQGAQQGAQHGAAIGSSKGRGGLITRAATRIGSNQGYQQGAHQGAQTAAKLENSLRQFANANPKDAQSAIAQFQNNLKSIDEAAQAQIRNTYAQHGLCAPANCGNTELQQAATQMGQLAQIPLPVANELVNQTPQQLLTTLEELQKAGESKVKQATALAKNCPNALSGMVKDTLGGSLDVAGESNAKYDFKKDMKENGGELLNALANLPQDTKQEIENAVIDTFKAGMKEAIGKDFSLDKILSQENLEMAKLLIEKNPQAVGKLMEEVSKTLENLPSVSVEKPNFSQLAKIGRVYSALEDSEILDSLKNANEDAYNKIQRQIVAFKNEQPTHEANPSQDIDNIFDK